MLDDARAGSCSTPAQGDESRGRHATGPVGRTGRPVALTTSSGRPCPGTEHRWLVMRDVVVVEAVRSPVGRRKGGLSAMHSADLLGAVQREGDRAVGDRPARGGSGRRRMRRPDRDAGGQRHPHRVARRRACPSKPRRPRSTRQCGSSQQATNLAVGLIAAGVVDVAVSCGVELMSAIPMGATVPHGEIFYGTTQNEHYHEHYESTSQFEGAERIAEKFGVTREDLDAFGKQSQDRAAQAWAEGRFDTQITPIEATDARRGRQAVGHAHRRARRRPARDHPRRPRQAQAGPRPRPRVPHRRHRVADQRRRGRAAPDDRGEGRRARTRAEGADRRHLPRRERPGAHAHGADPGHRAPPRAQQARRSTTSTWSRSTRRSVRWCSGGSGPSAPTWTASTRTAAPSHSDIRSGGTGSILLTKAVHELQRSGGQRALVTMCCGGGLGTGTILERV